MSSYKIPQTLGKITGFDKFNRFLLVCLLIGLPMFLILLVMRSLEVIKKPIDATTSAKVKEVRDRHMFGIITAFLSYNIFLTFCYVIIDSLQTIAFFKWIFIFINFGFAFSMMVIASDAIKKLKEGGKQDEYKQYLEMLIFVTGFSSAIVFIMLMWAFLSKPTSKPPALAPAKPAKPVQQAKSAQ